MRTFVRTHTHGVASALAVILSALAHAAQPSPPVDAEASRTPYAPDEAGFAGVVKPFVERHCLKCHGAEKQSGRCRIDTLRADFRARETAAAWIQVRDKLNLGELRRGG